MTIAARFLLGRLAYTPGLGSSSTCQIVRWCSNEGASASSSIIGACVLERLPLLVPETPAWEVEYKAWQQEWNLKKGVLKEYPRISKRAEAVAAGLVKQDETSSKDQEADFTPKTTAADASGDTSTMKRQLQHHVYLLVKQQAGWGFPKVAHQQGETIRQTAERALSQAIGSTSPVYFIGNAPMAHLDQRTGSTSSDDASSSPAAKTFYMLAQVQKDPWDVKLEQGYSECAWVTKEEMQNYLPEREAAVANAMLQ